MRNSGLEERRHRRGFVGPLILIALGLVFLLDNLGLLGRDVWHLLGQFWPLVLIAVGLEQLIGHVGRSETV
jgi:hypothetical protein